jgi:hypothetical protein
MNKIKKMKHHVIMRGNSSSNSNNFRRLENKWNERFFIEKIPNYDSLRDKNFLNLNIIKEKLRREELQLKGFRKKIKKSKTNSSHITLESKPIKSLNMPLIITNTENEKIDLFSLKFNNNIPLTITGNNNIRTEYNQQNILKRIYNNLYDLKTNKTEQKTRILTMNNSFQEEMNELKDLWKSLGITTEYQINFWKILSKYTDKEIIDRYISYEKKDLIQLKSEIEKLKKEILKRENDLEKLRKIDIIYRENENMYNYYKNSDSNEENEEQLNKFKDNKIIIENDIENLLKSLRLHTINTVLLFSKFRNQYNYYFTSGKIDINQISNENQFDYNYLAKVKTDTNFLLDTSLVTLYNFSNFENDPFFLSLLKKSEDNNEYKYLTATEDTLNTINQCMYIIDQEEMIFKINLKKINDTKPTFVKINQNFFGTNLKKEIHDLNRKNLKQIILNNTNKFKLAKQSPLFNIVLTEDFKNNNTNKI